METNKILSATLLDIVFDGRNKDYGAYELRKAYSKRLFAAIAAMAAAIALIFMSTVLANKRNERVVVMNKVDDKKLIALKPPVEPPPPPKPPPPSELPIVKVTRVTLPLILKDEQVRPDEMPPENDVINDSRIGTFNQDGAKDPGLFAPPVETKSAAEVIVPQVAQQDFEKTFTTVENPAEFPGGQAEWLRYLQKNLKYPELAIENGNESVVRVQFIVDYEGNISEVFALNNPGDGLAEEAVRIIKKGPKWKPAEQNGKKVKYRHIQSITFRLG